jgi:hypothetical protein
LEGYYDGNDDCTSKIKTKKNVYNLLLNYIICKFLNLILKNAFFLVPYVMKILALNVQEQTEFLLLLVNVLKVILMIKLQVNVKVYKIIFSQF